MKNSQALALVNQALSLTEQARYRLGTARFVTLFIEHWAYLHSGLYPASDVIPEDLTPVAVEMSHLLSKAMFLEPAGDAIGYLLSNTDFHKKGTNYFPTPPELSKLLSALVNVDNNTGYSFYEPCCGTAVNAIHWMERLVEEQGTAALSRVEIYLEDIDRLMVRASLLQLAHYFSHHKIIPKLVQITAINTLSRDTKGMYYCFGTDLSQCTSVDSKQPHSEKSTHLTNEICYQ